MLHRPTILGLLAACLAVGCVNTPVRAPVHAAASGLLPGGQTGIISNNGGALQLALSGTVSAPAELISKLKNATGIISDNGASLVGDKGNGLISKLKTHLLALPEQVPLAGVRVVALDAGGKALLGPDGAALSAVTDAQGHFAMAGPSASHNSLLVVDFGDAGQLRAIVPKAAKSADVDLVSTLTTTYILDRYVKSQADPLATLDRLPPDVEGTTRATAGQALAKGGLETPVDLTAATVDQAVDRLRGQNAELDAQLERVRQLLVVAGQQNLGSGRRATEVALDFVDEMAEATDGTLYLFSLDYHRVWRLRADGVLETAVGQGAAVPDAVVNGLSGPDVSIGEADIGLDDAQRLVVVEQGGWWTLGADGRTTVQGQLPVFGEGDTFYPRDKVVQTGPDDSGKLTLWQLVPGGGATPKASFDPWAGLTLPRPAKPVFEGRDTAGRSYAYTLPDPATHHVALYRYDPSTNAATRLTSDDQQGRVVTDKEGNAYMYGGATPGLSILHPDGSRVSPAGMPDLGNQEASFLLARDGSLYFAPNGVVYHLKDGVVTHLAGVEQAPAAGPTPAAATSATDAPLSWPAGIEVGPDGQLYIADSREAGALVYRVATDRTAEVIAGPGTPGKPGDGGPATAATLTLPTTLALDNAQTMYLLEADRVRAIAASGTIQTLYQAPAPFPFQDLAVADGTTLYLVGQFGTAAPGLYTLEAGAPKLVAALPASYIYHLAADPAGGLVIIASTPDDQPLRAGKLLHYSQAAGLVTMGEDLQFGDATRPAVDRKGRVYYGSDDPTVTRFDPATGAFANITGPGGLRFTGKGVDDGIDQPDFLAFNAAGDLLIADSGHGQVKRIPASDLP